MSTAYADPSPADVFQLAINEGALSRDRAAANYAGAYMYMYSERLSPQRIRHWFKHSVTRRTDAHVDEIPWEAPVRPWEPR